MTPKEKESYIQGYIDACEMFADFGFDKNCNDEMILTLTKQEQIDAPIISGRHTPKRFVRPSFFKYPQ